MKSRLLSFARLVLLSESILPTFPVFKHTDTHPPTELPSPSFSLSKATINTIQPLLRHSPTHRSRHPILPSTPPTPTLPPALGMLGAPCPCPCPAPDSDPTTLLLPALVDSLHIAFFNPETDLAPSLQYHQTWQPARRAIHQLRAATSSCPALSRNALLCAPTCPSMCLIRRCRERRLPLRGAAGALYRQSYTASQHDTRGTSYPLATIRMIALDSFCPLALPSLSSPLPTHQSPSHRSDITPLVFHLPLSRPFSPPDLTFCLPHAA
ncbi:hypothetical protein IWZ00DRAFT_87411 [Phyllosticta capitalensis]